VGAVDAVSVDEALEGNGSVRGGCGSKTGGHGSAVDTGRCSRREMPVTDF
jgi:hypothetical protein